MVLVLPYGTVSAQTPRPVLDSLASKSESVLDLEMSPTGRYAIISKSHESREPSLTISDTKNPLSKIVKSGISKYFFVKDDMILMQKGNIAYRIDLCTKKETLITNVQNIGTVEGSDLFLIHFDSTRNNELEIYDKNLNLRKTIQSVSRWTVTKDETIVFTSIFNEKKLVRLNADNGSVKEIWSSQENVYNIVKADIQIGGYIITYVTEVGLRTFWTDGNNRRIELQSPSLQHYDHIIVNKSSDPKAVFLTVSKKIPSDNQIVSLWYGNEQDLKIYTQGERKLTHFLWYPDENRIVILDTDYKGYSAIGQTGNFLRVKTDRTKADVMEGFHGINKDDVYLWNSITGKDIPLRKDLGFLYIDPTGRYLLSIQEDSWQLFDTECLQGRFIDMPKEAVPYFTTEHSILWCKTNEVWEQSILQLDKKRLFYAPWADHMGIINRKKESTDAGTDRMFHYTYQKDNLIICAGNKNENTVSYISLKGKTKKVIVPETTDRINKFKIGGNNNQYIWSSENYNRIPRVVKSSLKQPDTVIDILNRQDVKAEQIKRVIINYKDSNDRDLKASVFFPPDFNPEKKYPVVLSIYEKQQEFANRFLLTTMKNGRGINVRLLLESGYIVMLPDITYGDQGPGLSVLLCVNHALDALSAIPQVDMKKVGLMGQSFGGYETNFIAANSERFAAFISGASVSDIIHTSYSFNYNFQSPDYWRYEEGQFRMNTSFVNNNKKYFDNNPLYQASQVQAPMLLWTGTADKNVDQEETRTLFNVLRKYRKPVIALFYKDEGHSLSAKNAQTDLSLRVLDWFDYFLQNKKNIAWISKQMKEAF